MARKEEVLGLRPREDWEHFFGEISEVTVRDGRWFAPDGRELIPVAGDKTPGITDPSQLNHHMGHFNVTLGGKGYDVFVVYLDSYVYRKK